MRAPVIDDGSKSAMRGQLAENIRRLDERRRTEARARPASDRVADAIARFAGSMTFVWLHLALYGGWILVNLGVVPGVKPFDPSFVVLAMEASVEAIFLSTFVLINQNRMAEAADRRADLDLHINLLAEHELTRVADLLERIGLKLGVATDDPDYAEIKDDVEPLGVMDALDARRDDQG